MTSVAWLCVVGSGISAGVYLYFLARAYESSDFSIVYPGGAGFTGDLRGGWGCVARAASDRGRLGGRIPGGGGVIFVPIQSFRNISLKNYLNRTSLWMLLAALGTVGYTLLDKVAAETVQQSPATAARYGYFLLCRLIPAISVPAEDLQGERRDYRANFLEAGYPGGYPELRSLLADPVGLPGSSHTPATSLPSGR